MKNNERFKQILECSHDHVVLVFCEHMDVLWDDFKADITVQIEHRFRAWY